MAADPKGAVAQPQAHRFQSVTKGKFRARAACDAVDVQRAAALRALCFGVAGGVDRDAIDDMALHVLIEHLETGVLVGCYRLLPLRGARVADSYAAQFYDLSTIAACAGPLCELGRFCVHPQWQDADIVRLAWAAMTAFVDACGIEMLFGCASFAGTDPSIYADAFGLLYRRHLAPNGHRIGVKSPQTVRLEAFAGTVDRRAATAQMPPLLQTYLLMGGWVSDHAVVDAEMQTLHVFTALEIAAVPPARQRLLRAMVP